MINYIPSSYWPKWRRVKSKAIIYIERSKYINKNINNFIYSEREIHVHVSHEHIFFSSKTQTPSQSQSFSPRILLDLPILNLLSNWFIYWILEPINLASQYLYFILLNNLLINQNSSLLSLLTLTMRSLN